MANIQNLKMFTSDQDRDAAKRNGRKGGINSGKARKKKKQMRELLNEILQLPVRDGDITEEITSMDHIRSGEVNLSVEQAVLVAQVLKAMAGDTTAARFVRDTSGQGPKEVSNTPEFEDDGFTEAIKRSAKDVWK